MSGSREQRTSLTGDCEGLSLVRRGTGPAGGTGEKWSGVNDIEGNRVIGLDLGVTSAHSAVVLDARGQAVLRRRVVSTADSLAELEQAALRGASAQTRLTVVIEPTGPMWLPIAVYFGRRGHTVLRVSSAKAADLRRFLSRHAKSNSIDAETLARLPMVAPAGLHPVELGSAQRASLDRRVRAVAQHTQLRIDTGLEVYFCDPHSPWQRGTNENTNGLLRQYFPKGTDLSKHSASDLNAVAAALNNRPRKTLGWKTPAEALNDHLLSHQQNGVASTPLTWAGHLDRC